MLEDLKNCFYVNPELQLVRKAHKTCHTEKIILQSFIKFQGQHYRTHQVITYLQTGKIEKSISCKNCGNSFIYTTPTRIYCSHDCGVIWRTKHIYKHKFSVVHRGKSARNFLKSLAVKKSERRNLSVDFLEELYNKQKGLCAISGIEMTYLCGQGKVDTNISLDKIDPDLGYEESNIQLVCKRANILKFDRDMNDLLSWCKQIITFQESKKICDGPCD